MKNVLIYGVLLPCLLLTAGAASAGGVDPKEVPVESAPREEVTATPAETSSAVSKARKAVVPVTRETPVVKQAPIKRQPPKNVVVAPAPKSIVTKPAPAPVIKQVPMTRQQPKSVVSSPAPKPVVKAGADDWMLASHDGKCEPIIAASRKVKNIGSFETPQQLARKLQQRGYQSFALDIGDERDQMIRVKTPDLDLNLTFMRAGLCR